MPGVPPSVDINPMFSGTRWSPHSRLVCGLTLLGASPKIDQAGSNHYLAISHAHERERPTTDFIEEHWDGAVPVEQEIQDKPQTSAASAKATLSYDGTLIPEAKSVAQFRFRILVVDDEPSIREVARNILENGGYEVLTAADGLDGIRALSKSLPDLIISDLNMPRMSGFEFLAVVRKRFPHIATIAMTGQHIAVGDQCGIVADALLPKDLYTFKELFCEIAKLLAASPIRPRRKKSEIAPLLVPRDMAGYLTMTCPKCLRPNKLEATDLNGGLHERNCRSCGSPMRFEINHEIEPLLKPNRA